MSRNYISLSASEKIANDNGDLLSGYKKETACGFWLFRGKFLQRFANKKAFVLLYGIVGCLFSASYAYNSGTITTLEKRFKIPSRTTGI